MLEPSINNDERIKAQAHSAPLFPVQSVAAAQHLAELHPLAAGRGALVVIVDSGVDLPRRHLAGHTETCENLVV
jgi:hypothetical protein